MTEIEMMKELEKFDTPSITNVVATYPKADDVCLGLYTPWETDWYTNTDLKCIYPELGRKCGFAVTAVFGLPSGIPGEDRRTYNDVMDAIHESDKPVIVVIKQALPENIKKKSGFSGGLLTSRFKKLGAIGCISDGPSRDIDEIREMKFQYMLTGVTPGHGTYAVKAVNVPVNVCGMDVAPGDIIHMDENGAVKFPRRYLPEVLERVKILQQKEAKQFAMFEAAQTYEEIRKIPY